MDQNKADIIAHRLMQGVLLVEFESCNTPEQEEAISIGRMISRLAENYGRCPVVVNLHMLQLVSNELMEQLVALARRLKPDGRRLAVCCLRPEVITLYKVLELDDILPHYDSVEQAVNALTS